MIEHNRKIGVGSLSCDKCSFVEDYYVWEFSDMVGIAKRDGWRIFKKDEVWKHYCMSCN